LTARSTRSGRLHVGITTLISGIAVSVIGAELIFTGLTISP
jgi:hypothetical protein